MDNKNNFFITQKLQNPTSSSSICESSDSEDSLPDIGSQKPYDFELEIPYPEEEQKHESKQSIPSSLTRLEKSNASNANPPTHLILNHQNKYLLVTCDKSLLVDTKNRFGISFISSSVFLFSGYFALLLIATKLYQRWVKMRCLPTYLFIFWFDWLTKFDLVRLPGRNE